MPAVIPSQYRPIRVVVTAGSAIAAGQLARDLSNEPSLEISHATSAVGLFQQIATARPAVVLLDTQIAGNNTSQLVADLIQRSNLPILLRADCNTDDPVMLLDCIDAGGLGIISKPGCADEFARSMPSLIWNLNAAAGARMNQLNSIRATQWPTATAKDTQAILAIGAGMGGATVLGHVLGQLPQDGPGTVVIAPLPAQIIQCWTRRLQQSCRMRLSIARSGHPIERGDIYVAPGNAHVLLRRNGSEWTAQIKDGPSVFHQKPSIEMLFNSIADCAASEAVGVLLGSAGVDGIAGLMQMRKAGSRTLTESPATSLFPDLPMRALQCSAAETSVPANEIAQKMLELATLHQIPQAA